MIGSVLLDSVGCLTLVTVPLSPYAACSCVRARWSLFPVSDSPASGVLLQACLQGDLCSMSPTAAAWGTAMRIGTKVTGDNWEERHA